MPSCYGTVPNGLGPVLHQSLQYLIFIYFIHFLLFVTKLEIAQKLGQGWGTNRPPPRPRRAMLDLMGYSCLALK